MIRQFYYDTNPLDSAGTFSQYALGRLTAVQNAPTANADTFIEMYSYTQPGEVTKKRLRLNRTVQSHPFTLDLDASYSYDNEGKMTSVTYPQSFYSDGSLQPQPSPLTTYTYGFDTMGRPTSMTGPGVDNWGNPATVNIVNNVQYGPASELQQMSYFGATETRQYNTRLQMTHLTVPGQINISYNFASQNNGQISSQTDNLSGEQITYQYDALQRLNSATTSAWSQTFTYDGFGNLTDKVGTGGAPTNHSPANAATNQLTGYSYDANGNLLTTGYGWDPENRMSYATFGGTQYAYDSANKRIWTGNYTCPGGFCGPGYGWQFQSETVFFYGIDGKQLASYTPQVKYLYGTPQSIYYLIGEERVYFGKYIGNANTSLMSGGTSVAQDRLGSTGKYFPYGEERSNPQSPNDAVKFATYTRDSATGLDYADQRYFASGLGRFTSVDPHRPSGGPDDSRSWNSYTYVGNDPINFNDPAGLDMCYVGNSTWTPTGGGPVITTPLFAPCGLSTTDTMAYLNSWAAFLAQQQNDLHGNGDEVADKRRREFAPRLRGRDITTVTDAIKHAKDYAHNHDCDVALTDYGIPSLEALVDAMSANGNIFDGRYSNAPRPDGMQVADYLKQGTAGAVSMIGSLSTPQYSFVGDAFFDPSIANVKGVDSQLAQAFMILHESVHAAGGVGDAAFGGSHALTQKLLDNCFPVLKGRLGNLY